MIFSLSQVDSSKRKRKSTSDIETDKNVKKKKGNVIIITILRPSFKLKKTKEQNAKYIYYFINNTQYMSYMNNYLIFSYLCHMKLLKFVSTTSQIDSRKRKKTNTDNSDTDEEVVKKRKRNVIICIPITSLISK